MYQGTKKDEVNIFTSLPVGFSSRCCSLLEAHVNSSLVEMNGTLGPMLHMLRKLIFIVDNPNTRPGK